MAAPARHPVVKKNDDIEALRGVAILAVLGAHLSNLSTLGRFLPAWLADGGAGVQLFFVISGFVVGRSLMRSLDGAESDGTTRARAVMAFYCRRVFRLAPIAVVSIVLAYVLYSGYRLIGIDSLAALWRDIELIVTLRLNYAEIADIRQHPLSIFWSLMVEEHFYLALPLVLISVRSVPLRAGLALVIIVGTVAVLRPSQYAVNDPHDLIGRRILYATHLALDFFAAGLLVAILETVRGRLDLAAWRLPLRVLSLGLMAFILGVGQSWAGDDLVRLMASRLAASTVLVFLAAQDSGAVVPGGAFRAGLSFVGSRSYALYLLHIPLLLWFQSQFFDRSSRPGLDVWDVVPVLGAIVSIVALVEALHRWLEQPFIERGRVLAGRLLAR